MQRMRRGTPLAKPGDVVGNELNHAVWQVVNTHRHRSPAATEDEPSVMSRSPLALRSSCLDECPGLIMWSPAGTASALLA